MAEFKIDGRMKVKKLKENFFNEFGGVLRVYNGRCKAQDDASLASIRSNDVAKGGELLCRASRTVGKFEQEMWDIFGIKVQVATKDDFILALDGITLAKLKDIPEKATKEIMEDYVAYKRKEKNEVIEESIDLEEPINEGNPYQDIIDKMEGESLIYVPTYEQNEDGCSLNEVDMECLYDAYSQINAPIGDYENGEISCFEECDKVDLSKDGVYFNPDTYDAVAILGEQIISALCNDGETLRIGDQEFDVNEL